LLLLPSQAGNAASQLYGVAKGANVVSVKVLDDAGQGRFYFNGASAVAGCTTASQLYDVANVVSL
jgi:hypothetical protein